jgi:hypothetical protein
MLMKKDLYLMVEHLLVEDLSDSDRKRLGINQYGKIVEEDSEDDSGFVEPEEVSTDDEW